MCADAEAVSDNIRHKIAEDILSRMQPDFFFFIEKEKNIEKLLKSSVFQDIDLNDDGIMEIIVKVNWLSDGSDGFAKGYSFVRGAKDQGIWQIYYVRNNGITHIGTIADGNTWKVLGTK